MKNGWEAICKAWDGACDDYQHYYIDGEDIGYVNGFDYDGDWGYNAYITIGECEWKFAGRFNSRKKAQERVENERR